MDLPPSIQEVKQDPRNLLERNSDELHKRMFSSTENYQAKEILECSWNGEGSESLLPVWLVLAGDKDNMKVWSVHLDYGRETSRQE